ncbi:retrovirus-related pol polyprotein from transposon TNT 1-94 [Tanacetum coccineum]
MVEEVTSLKKDFKQKENKYLEEFLDMKALKEKAKDKLYKQDQSLQTVHMLCKPKPYYDELKRHEIIKTNHVSAIVHNSEDTLEIAETTRKLMNEKMKDPECVKKKDLIKMKAEALKEQTTASRPIKTLMVYLPNTPAMLVPRVLLTKSQVKINIFALIQLFLEFEKTCKKRITPTGLTEVERGFEQTKECYLTEVIPFFKTLKGHFEGIQKALTKEIKEMNEIFEELEAEVDQNVVNRKHDEIERKNILISNDNLLVDCLSKDVFYIATNSELTVSRFTKMHDAHIVVQARCLELKAELSKLHDKVQKDDHNELVKHFFSNLEVHHLNLQLKYQSLKESFGNNTSLPIRDAIDFDSVFHYNDMYDSIKITRAKHIEQTTPLLTKNENLKAQIHENLKCITMDSVKPRVLALGRYAIDVKPLPPRIRNNREAYLDYLKYLKEIVETLREIVEAANVERPLDRSLASSCLYTKHSQELLEYGMGVNSCTDANGSYPRSNTKKNRISSAKSVNKKKVEEHPRTNKSSLKITNRGILVLALSQVWKPKQVKQVWKASGKVLTSVGYQWRPTGRIFTLGEQCPLTRLTKPKEVPAMQTENHSCYVRDTNGVELIKGSRDCNLYTISVEDMLKSSLICLLSKASKNKSWLWHHRLNHLNFCTINDLARKDLVRGLPRLKFEKDHLCSACQLGKSKNYTQTPKTENTNLKVLNTLHIDLCGPMRVQTINWKKYILVIVDDYSRFTWVKFLRSKDETPEFVINFLKQIQVALNKTVKYIRTDNGTKFVNQVLTQHYESVGIFHQKSVLRTPQQNGIVERWNRTLVEAVRTMLVFSKAPMFLWAEAIATVCYT